ncbi:hypothetical protein Ddye_007942 [Dipteronia dyeriana]|uniref:Transposase MuDR plant domain-containing protein n=1 Tax=Dipteronia dyeriana TaxID=168575 RepID=A0AAD9XKY1_9ROSI|nr:hypothetical protein Ddye_007942 [Dipteronia dyeriana]
MGSDEYENIYQLIINDSGDGVLNEENDNDNSDEDPNENNDSGDEYDVNEDGITQEEVLVSGNKGDKDKERDQPNKGIAFKLGGDDRIKLEVGQLFKDGSHFKEIILGYSIQEGFKLKRIRNERRRITYGCEANGFALRVHSSPTYDRVTYMLKIFTDNHNYLAVPKNSDVTSVWLRNKFEIFIKENPSTNIKVGRNPTPTLGHLGLASTHDGTTTSAALGGLSTAAAPTCPLFSSAHEEPSIPRDASNHVSTQPLTQDAPHLSNL